MNAQTKELLASLIEYAEKLAEINGEPADGQCKQTIRKAQALIAKVEEEAASALKAASTYQLTNELRARGLVVSAWSEEDLDFVYDAKEFEDLETEAIDQIKPAIFERCSKGLEDILSSRGNEHLSTMWDLHGSEIILEIALAKPAAATV